MPLLGLGRIEKLILSLGDSINTEILHNTENMYMYKLFDSITSVATKKCIGRGHTKFTTYQSAELTGICIIGFEDT